MLKHWCLCRPPPLSLPASQALSTSRFPSTGVGDWALLYSRASTAQSLDQGYPRESVAQLRTDPPPTPRLQLAGVLQHLPAQPKTPLEISWPMQKGSKARNPKLSTPGLSGAKRHRLCRRSPPALAQPRRASARAQTVPEEDTALPGDTAARAGSTALRRWGWERGEGTGHKARTRRAQKSCCQRMLCRERSSIAKGV